MTSCITQVDQAALGQEDQVVVTAVVIFAADNPVNLWLNFFQGPVFAHVSGIDFAVKVTNVADYGA